MRETTRIIVYAMTAVLAVAGTAGAAKEKPLPKELPPYGQERPLPVPSIVNVGMDNGLTVWVVPRAGFPKVTAILAVRGGTAADPEKLAGTADVLADVVKEGTTSRSSRQIAEELQAVGGEISTHASNDALYVSVDGLAPGTAKVLEILADVARNAAFPRNEVELAKANALQGLLAQESTPEFSVDKAFGNAVFGAHPYRTVAPTKEAVEALTPQTLMEQYRRRFRPDRALLVVVGEVDAQRTGETIKRVFGTWKGQGDTAPATPPAPAGGTAQVLVVDRPGSVQSEIRVGRATVKVTDPEYFPEIVANTIFGGAFSSRLVENIREDKGYTYSPSSRVSAYEEGGMLRIRAAVRNDVTAGTLLEIFYELDRMGATLPTEDEVARAKRYQSGLFLLRNSTQGALASTLATNWVNGLPPAALAEFVPKVNAVSAEQVREVGRKLFTSRSQTVVIGGDAKKIAAEVAQFGETKPANP
jgi:predicted Zn-dependent peptidase